MVLGHSSKLQELVTTPFKGMSDALTEARFQLCANLYMKDVNKSFPMAGRRRPLTIGISLREVNCMAIEMSTETGGCYNGYCGPCNL